MKKRKEKTDGAEIGLELRRSEMCPQCLRFPHDLFITLEFRDVFRVSSSHFKRNRAFGHTLVWKTTVRVY